MSASKKRKLSGLSGLELDLALTHLRKLRSSAPVEDVLEADPAPEDTLMDQLDSIIATLESRVNSPLSLSFSAANANVLERFGIVQKGMLYPRRDSEIREAIIASRTLGSDKLWSNDAMLQHLTFLISSFPLKNGTSSRTVIDTFFFRSISMVSPPQKVIMMLGNQVPAIRSRRSQMDTNSGIVDYTAIVAESSVAERYIRSPPTVSREYGDEMSAFFVVAEAKTFTHVDLEGYLPQFLLKLVAYAKHLGKLHIRGALTTGFKWLFVAVDLDKNDDGANYWVSELIEWKWKTKRSESEPLQGTRFIKETYDDSDPAFIAGILSSWIPNSFSEFVNDEWFVKDS